MSRLPTAPDAGPMPKLLLVVEDHDAARAAVAQMFRRMGWEAVEATTVPEALEVVADIGRLIDLVLLDLMLPGLPGTDGVTVCEAIRAGGFPARVFAWTALPPGSKMVSRVIAAGVDGVLIKPFCGLAEFRLLASGGTPDGSDVSLPQYRPDEGR